jgi:hypothetical protein
MSAMTRRLVGPHRPKLSKTGPHRSLRPPPIAPSVEAMTIKPLFTRVARDVSGKVVLLTGAANGHWCRGRLPADRQGRSRVAPQDTA